MSIPKRLQAQLAQADMPFVEFMQFALYDPQDGYYSSPTVKLGRQGDFITAPELTPLFGYTVANQCRQIMNALDSPSLFELGAGTGALCVALLKHLQIQDCLPQHYYILEVSANLRLRQQEYIGQQLPDLIERVVWLERWPERPFNGVILANEVLDAMPVHRFLHTPEGLLESHVHLSSSDDLEEIFKPCTNPRLMTYVHDRLKLKQTPYLSEANLFLDAWVASLYACLKQGIVLLIDYGFPRHEYYHPDRNQGTLMCHYQHRSHSNPLIHLGGQDITAHVDFTQVAEAAVEAGFHVAGYTNQASFLLANGLLSLIQEGTATEQLKAKQLIKQLTHPTEMGELFKVIALNKEMEIDLTGFQLHDKRVSL